MSTSLYRIGNAEISNPIVIASCPATEDRERLLQCAGAGAAAAVLKSCHTTRVTPEDNGQRRFQQTGRGLWGTSTVARELLHPLQACELFRDIRQTSDLVVIPSVAGFTLECGEWLDTLRLLEPLSPPCVQLDLFYLHEDISRPRTQQRLSRLIAALRQECCLDLLPKLNQELRPGAALDALAESGITGWSLLDSIRTRLPIDVLAQSSDFPEFQFASGLNSASLFGPWQLPLVTDYVFQLRKETALPILAGGGVTNADDVVRLLSLGANAVQVATPVLIEGANWIRRTLDDLERCGTQASSSTASPVHFESARATIDQGLCTSCGRCTSQLMCNAIDIKMDAPRINPADCEGCGFCANLCPKGAIYMHSASDQDFSSTKEPNYDS